MKIDYLYETASIYRCNQSTLDILCSFSFKNKEKKNQKNNANMKVLNLELAK